MSTVTVDLTVEQIMAAVRRLPLQEKATLKKALEAELDDRLGQLLAELWAENRSYSEEEVMADVAKAIAEARAKYS
jgi:hypothetical protein